MKLYLMSLGAGPLVGVIYAVIDVRSPAPPVVALIGLLAGEQIPPLIKGYLFETPPGHSWLQHHVRPHVFGHLPRGGKAEASRLAQSPADPSRKGS